MYMVSIPFKIVLSEVERVLSSSNFEEIDQFIECICRARIVVVYGAGRFGLSMRNFAKRLRQLGVNAFFLEDTTVPRTGVGDVLIIGSGSGETPTVKTVVEVAHSNGLNILALTSNPSSSISNLSSVTLLIEAPSKLNPNHPNHSIQPMTSLFEQSLYVLLDSIVLVMMDKLGETSKSMSYRHNSLE